MTLAALLTQVAHYAMPDGRSDGVETFGSPMQVCVRHERVDVVVIGPDNKERRARHRVASMQAIPYDALYWPPGVDQTVQNNATRPLSYSEASTPEGDLTLFETYFA